MDEANASVHPSCWWSALGFGSFRNYCGLEGRSGGHPKVESLSLEAPFVKEIGEEEGAEPPKPVSGA